MPYRKKVDHMNSLECRRLLGAALITLAVTAGTAHGAIADTPKSTSVAVKKVALGQGIHPSVDVTVDYTCVPGTGHLTVRVHPVPSLEDGGSLAVLLETHSEKLLKCDGSRHADWFSMNIDDLDPADAPAFGPGKRVTATAGLYNHGGTPLGSAAEKTVVLNH
ncbi:hypothetical protein [Streptomyces roseoverticillatus]|uniref:Secreted protein n=1 Tax=Streptomyces roseoverticillatus TaxID=66429 RepID=A0ABV3IV30_9ACTN